MKKILAGLMIVGSIASYADTSCTYFPREKGGEIDNSISDQALRIVDRKMKKKGFKKVYDLKDADYTVEYASDWYTGAFNGMDHEVCGDAYARVDLVNNSDSRVKASGRKDGMAGFVCGIAKDAKSNFLLSRALRAIPDCEELTN